MAKRFNRDIDLTGDARLVKGATVLIDADGNIDAPVTTTNLSTSGTTTIGDAATDALTVNAGVTASVGIQSSVTGLFAPFMPLAVQQAVSTATAVNLTTYYTTVDSTSGALALTLADSTVKGQIKKVQMIVDGGDATLTFNTDATIVFADVGDTAELIWNGSDWIPVALYNIVDGATAPAYTPAS